MQVVRVCIEGHVRDNVPPVDSGQAHGHPGHILISPGQDDIAESLGDFHESDMDGRHGRPALLVHKLGRYRFREVGQEDGVTPAVGPLLAHGRGAAHDKIIDFFGLQSGSFNHLGEQFGQEFVSSHLAEHVPGRVIGPGAGLGCS